MKRLLLILGMVSVLTAQTATIKNSIVGYSTLGDIVFFPSSLHHRTIPFSTDTDRIIVSFDLKPKQF